MWCTHALPSRVFGHSSGRKAGARLAAANSPGGRAALRPPLAAHARACPRAGAKVACGRVGVACPGWPQRSSDLWMAGTGPDGIRQRMGRRFERRGRVGAPVTPQAVADHELSADTWEDWASGGVYVGGLPFEADSLAIREWIARQCSQAAALPTTPERVLVPGFEESKRRSRDSGKKTRGFAYVRFQTTQVLNHENETGGLLPLITVRESCSWLFGRGGLVSNYSFVCRHLSAALKLTEADAAVAVFSGADMQGRIVKASRNVDNLQTFLFPPAPMKPKELNSDKQRKLIERREHKRRWHQRKSAALRAEQEAILCRLVPEVDANTTASGESTGKDVESWETYYSTWKQPSQVVSTLGAIDWSQMPESLDPARGGGLKLKQDGTVTWRAKRKYRQVESFLALLLASGVANKEGVKIVDFGSGSGNLTLPLAHLFPHAKFVAVDFKDEAITLLQERVKAAGLTNVEAICGTVEEYEDEFDVCIALHVCGSGTDVSMIKAVEQGASYFVSPCCIGKLQASEGLVNPSKRGPSEGLQLVHPRSRWMQKAVQRDEFVKLATAADYSGHTGVSGYDPTSPEGRIPRFAKAALEADRNAAAREHGYSTRLMKLLHPQACVRNDLLVGFPDGQDLLSEYVIAPLYEWGDDHIDT